MLTEIVILMGCAFLLFLGTEYGRFIRSLLTSMTRPPSLSEVDHRRALLFTTALKHFATFAVVFAILYSLQIFFGDAEPWLSK